MSDYISREEAYQQMLDLQTRKKERYLDIDDVRKVLYKMPSADVRENKWIPVIERLPKITDVYRVTRYYPNNVMNPKYLVDACAFDGSNTWYDDNRLNPERAYVNNVIAWQENPEPYKADMRGK